jgi:hypothetical protein
MSTQLHLEVQHVFPVGKRIVTSDRRPRLLKLLSDIDQQIAEAERLTVEAPDDKILLGASAKLAELREALERVEFLLGRDA